MAEQEKLERNLKMLDMHENGMTYILIARVYNISHTRASKIVKHYKRIKYRNETKN